MAAGHVLNRLGYGPNSVAIKCIKAVGLDQYIEEQVHPETIEADPCYTSRGEALFLEAQPFQERALAAVGHFIRYFKGTQQPPRKWKHPDFDASGWLRGQTEIGYGKGDDATVLSDMQSHYLSVYLRRRFMVDGPWASKSLVLEMAYDDGLVVYLNGFEVGRSYTIERNGHPPAHDEGSRRSHRVTLAKAYINPGQFPELLRPGQNVLAIPFYNVSLNSSELSCLARLLDRKILPAAMENRDPRGVWIFRFNPAEHNTQEKVLFAGTEYELRIPAAWIGPGSVRDALDVIDFMVRHPSCAEFICIELIQRFASDRLALANL